MSNNNKEKPEIISNARKGKYQSEYRHQDNLRDIQERLFSISFYGLAYQDKKGHSVKSYGTLQRHRQQ